MTPSNSDSEKPLFTAILRPHRSLSPLGYKVVLGVVAAVNVFFAGYFALVAAWPMIFFCLIDFLAVMLAFEISFRDGRSFERIELTADKLQIDYISPTKPPARICLQPFWTRLEFEEPVRHDSQVRLVSKGETAIVGAFMAPEERARFARSMRDALAKARAPRRGAQE